MQVYGNEIILENTFRSNNFPLWIMLLAMHMSIKAATHKNSFANCGWTIFLVNSRPTIIKTKIFWENFALVLQIDTCSLNP